MSILSSALRTHIVNLLNRAKVPQFNVPVLTMELHQPPSMFSKVQLNTIDIGRSFSDNGGAEHVNDDARSSLEVAGAWRLSGSRPRAQAEAPETATKTMHGRVGGAFNCWTISSSSAVR